MGHRHRERSPPRTIRRDDVPGRSWLRLAAVIAAAVLLLVAVVVAYNLGRGRTPLGAVPDDDPTTSRTPSSQPSSSPPGGPITGVTATDFDPQGDPPEENPDLAPLAVDGDRATAWRTQTYEQNLGPGGLKTGVGLVLDLGESRSVSAVDLTLIGSPTDVSLYLTGTAPTDVADLKPVATASITGERDRVDARPRRPRAATSRSG